MKRSVLVALAYIVVVTVIFALFTFPKSATASLGDQKARWFIEVGIHNNQLIVKRTIEIGYEDRLGNLLVITSETTPISCQEDGQLIIENNKATFDGNTFLICEMPSFQEKVYDLTNGQLVIEDECDFKVANGTAEFIFTKTGENPFFYQPELQFSAPMNAISRMAKYEFVAGGSMAKSEPFMTNQQMQGGGAAFFDNGLGYLTHFHVDGVTLGSNPPFLPGTLTIPTTSTEFFIGINLDTSETLQGILGSLIVDPGCVGHGGI
ncbi:hypothetical protein [Candidatus Leptofilum sp.]|uniref:hypothetical protein n=1 Tax=Candidatus Leptofilum sp. TaxID=3241576 RepID=UPI003B5B4136